jgi:transposase
MVNEVNQSRSRGRRSRYSALEKKRIVEETYEQGSSVSYVARQRGVSLCLLYKWRKSMEEGAIVGLDYEDALVSKKEITQLKAHILELERALGRKTLDNEILKEAIKLGREKN